MSSEIQMSSDSLSLRYFSPNLEMASANGGMIFEFAYAYTLASYEAIWGKVSSGTCRARLFNENETDLMGFTLDTEEYERGLELVSSLRGAAPPIALQFEELLKELRCWDEEESSSPSSGPDDVSSDEEAARAPIMMRQRDLGGRKGRAVPQMNYREK